MNDEGTDIYIDIEGEENKALRYVVHFMEFEEGSESLIEYIREKITTEAELSVEEVTDPKNLEETKQKISGIAKRLLTKELPKIPTATRDYMVAKILREMMGLGKIEVLFNDKFLEDIVIVSSTEYVKVFHRKYGWLTTNIIPNNEEQIKHWATKMGRSEGREISTLKPILDCSYRGCRVHAELMPITKKGNEITLRKYREEPWTVTDMILNNTCSADVLALIWQAIQYERNIIFSGATSSGKTTFMNLCMAFIPPNQSVISIEDTAELLLPDHLFWRPRIARLPNPEGLGEVAMLDLLVGALRAKPDRIIFGEVRRHEEVEVLFEGIHTGHSIYATLHADDMEKTVKRLANPPLSVPIALLDSIDLNAVLFRDRRRGIRRVLQVGEIFSSEDGTKAMTNPIYEWDARTDKIKLKNKPMYLFKQLERDTGMTEAELKKDLKEREKILTWFAKHKLKNLEQIQTIMKNYYTEPSTVFEIIKSKK